MALGRDAKKPPLIMERAARLLQEETPGSYRPPDPGSKPWPVPATTQNRGSHTDSWTSDSVTFIYLLSCLGNPCQFFYLLKKKMRESTVRFAWPGNSPRPVFLLVRINSDLVLLCHLCSFSTTSRKPRTAMLFSAAHCALHHPSHTHIHLRATEPEQGSASNGKVQPTPPQHFQTGLREKVQACRSPRRTLPRAEGVAENGDGWKRGQGPRDRTLFCVLTLTSVEA